MPVLAGLSILAGDPFWSETQGKLAPKPLFCNPVYDGAADPVFVWDRAGKKWLLFYTNRRANVPHLSKAAWVHGTRRAICLPIHQLSYDPLMVPLLHSGQVGFRRSAEVYEILHNVTLKSVILLLTRCSVAMSQISPPTHSQGSRISTVRKRKFYLLFLFLLAYLILYPYIQNRGFEYLAFRAFGVSVTLLSVYAVSFRRRFVFIALVLAVPTLVQRLLLPRGDEGILALLSIIFSFAFDVFIVVVIFRRVFAKHVPNAETIFGALCIYLLVGFSFASLYHMLDTVQARAFYLDPASNVHPVPSHFDLIYYSFGIMTSLGAAGMTPVSDQARSLSVIEAILGILYLAVLISKLMSAYQTDRGE